MRTQPAENILDSAPVAPTALLEVRSLVSAIKLPHFPLAIQCVIWVSYVLEWVISQPSLLGWVLGLYRALVRVHLKFSFFLPFWQDCECPLASSAYPAYHLIRRVHRHDFTTRRGSRRNLYFRETPRLAMDKWWRWPPLGEWFLRSSARLKALSSPLGQ